MWKTFRLLVTGLLVVFSSSAVRAGDDEEARAIVARAIEATGGRAKLAKFHAATWKEKGTYYGMGDALPYTASYAVQWPGRFRMEIEGHFTLVLNGDQGWIKGNGDTREMTREELAVQKHDNRAGWITTLLPLQGKDFALSLLGEVKVDNRPALGVKVVRKGYPEVKLYFDKATNLLVKCEYRTKAPEQEYKEVTAEASYSQFHDVDGVKIPTKRVMKRDGKLFVEAEARQLKAAGKLDDKVFSRP